MTPHEALKAAVGTVHTGVDPRTLNQLRGDIRQLAEPIHLAVRGRIVTHHPLLDQLRTATQPNAAQPHEPTRRPIPASRPPARLDALDALGTIIAETAQWHARLRLPGSAGATVATLHALAKIAPTLAPQIAEWLALDVREWWRSAAVHSGWKPTELLRVR